MVFKSIIVSTGVLLSLFLSVRSYAQDLPKPKDFDLNGSGKLEINELRALILHITPREYTLIDEDKNGIVEALEAENATAGAVNFIKNELKSQGPFSFDQLESYFKSLYRPDLKLLGIKVRESYEVVTFDKPLGAYDKAKAATLSFNRNIIKSQNVFTAKGSILRPITLDSGRFGLVPSITFNRTIFNKILDEDKDKEANSLIGRVGFHYEIPGGFFNLQTFRLLLDYGTDFDFKSKQIASELEWEPLGPSNLSIGLYKPIKPLGIEFRTRVVLHLEYGYVYDPGEKENIQKGVFFRAGPKTQLEIRPASPALRRLELSGRWEFLRGFVGTPKVSRLSNVKLSYEVDPKGHFSIQSEYTKGQVPLTSETIETLLFGVGIKF